MKYYVLTKDLEIGYIESICRCSECQKRGNAEITINNLDDSYMLETKIHNIINKDVIIAISTDIDDLKNIKESIRNSESFLCEFLEKELLKKV